MKLFQRLFTIALAFALVIPVVADAQFQTGFPPQQGNSGNVLQTDGLNMEWVSPGNLGGSSATLDDVANNSTTAGDSLYTLTSGVPVIFEDSGNSPILELDESLGVLTIGGSYTLPTNDGSSGQVLQTDGSGNVTFQSGATSLDLYDENFQQSWNADTSGSNGVVIGGVEDFSGNSLITSGNTNTASGTGSITLGGTDLTASGGISAVIAGGLSTVDAESAFIGGGQNNFISGRESGIIGGHSNNVSGQSSFIGGGFLNQATGDNAAVIGGSGDITSKDQIAEGVGSAVIGGRGNKSSGLRSGVMSSLHSTSVGDYSSVVGGRNSEAASYHEVVVGSNNTKYTANNPTGFDSGDRVFTVANGVYDTSFGGTKTPSDALTILKSGTTSVGIDNLESNGTGELFQVAGTSRLNSLNINGNYVFPTTDGSGGDVLSTDGNGNVDFTDPNTLNTSPELYEENQVNTFNPTVTGNNSVAVGGGSQTEHESSGTDSFVAGGYGNTASGSQSGVYVGYNNVAANSQSVVVGGRESTASARGAIVAGGSGNEATARESGTFAGDGNTATSEHATAVGGSSNDATADDSSVVGGTLNLASGQKSAILGSRNSESSGEESAVVGGSGHTASGLESAVLGGNGANVSGERSVAASGNGNDVNSDDTFVSGQNNTANGVRGFIAGGNQNSITGTNAFAQGKEVTAPSFSEAVFGTYPTDYIAQSSFAFNSGDRVFNVGNGVSGSNSDAFTVMKSGTTSVGIDNLETNGTGQLFQVAGTARLDELNINNNYTLTTTDGSSGDVLTTDGSGNVTFQAGGASQLDLYSENFVNAFNSSASGDNAVVIAGTNQTASGTRAVAMGGTNHEASGLNAGTYAGDTTTASGQNSVALGGFDNDVTAQNAAALGGTLNTVSGTRSVAVGNSHIISGFDMFAAGQAHSGSGYRAMGVGNTNTLDGNNSFAQGMQNTAASYNEVALGSYGTTYTAASTDSVNTNDRVLNVGNGSSTAVRSDAFTVLKSGTTSVGVDNLEGSTAYDRQFNVNGTALAEGLMVDSQNRIPMRSPGANTLALGDGTTSLSTLVLGNGQSNSSPVSKSKIQGTIASGTDVSGSDLEYVAGAGTGNAEPGIHRFLTSTKLSSGNTQQNTSLAFRIEDTRVNSFKSFDVNSNYVDFANMSAPSNANTNEGRMFLDSSDNKLKASEDGELYEPVLNNHKKLGSIAITSVATNSEVTLYSYTVDAGSLEGENVLETKVDISDFDLTSGESATLRAKFGGTTFASVEINNDTGAAFTDHTGTIKARLVASGTTNQQGAIEANFSNGGSYEDDHAYAQDSGSTGLDTTNDQTLEITAELTSGGSAGNSIASTIGEAKLIQ